MMEGQQNPEMKITCQYLAGNLILEIVKNEHSVSFSPPWNICCRNQDELPTVLQDGDKAIISYGIQRVHIDFGKEEPEIKVLTYGDEITDEEFFKTNTEPVD